VTKLPAVTQHPAFTQRPSLIKHLALIILTIVIASGAAFAQTTSFTYQGRLTDNGVAANGSYDLQFALFSTVNGAGQIGQTQTIPNVSVSGGVFTVTLDFGANSFPGQGRFLEISTRASGSGPFTTLTPRQPITSTPYAVRSLNSTNADTAANAQQLGGVAANQYVTTTDPRLTNERSPAAGSTNYIANSSNLQNAQFNISGNGSVGGLLNGSIINSNLQYMLAGQRIAARIGTNGLLLGSPNLPVAVGDNANVGIGTENPQTALPNGRVLDVEGQHGAIRLGGIGAQFEWQATKIGPNGTMNLYNVMDGTSPFTVLTNGNVGIGTTTPTSPLPNSRILDIEGGSSNSIRLGTSSFTWEIQNTVISGNHTFNLSNITGFSNPLTVMSNGNVGLSETTPTARLDVNGNVKIRSLGAAGVTQLCLNTSNEVSNCSSSRKYKTDFQNFNGGMNVVNRLQPLTFKWKDNQQLDLGLGAEDVAAVEPLLVVHNDKGEVEGVKYDRLSAVFINAFKEQQTEIISLRAANTALQQRLLAIEKRLKRHSLRRK
jgi:hypothetical protein